MTITAKEKIYNEGHYAYWSEGPYAVCPYNEHTQEVMYDLWCEGHSEAWDEDLMCDGD